ncbi:MAG: hypothetical protein PHS66_06935 [Candidatus Omnitrophica bacterium]|nr:hypothetical protein [Candidatus Omnitrophota bacterium]
MNWFERYGIVGMFFIAMICMWGFCLFSEPSFILLNQIYQDKGFATLIVGFFGLLFLPIGYIIVIFEQLIYYRLNIWKKVHYHYWNELPESKQKGIIALEKIDNKNWFPKVEEKSEDELESLLAYYDRMHMANVENNKFLSIFASKRYDVIAINRSLILTICITGVFAICLKLFMFSLKIFGTIIELKACSILWSILGSICLFLLPLVIAGGIWFILHHSSGILEHQIIDVGKRKFRDYLFNQKDQTVSRSKEEVSANIDIKIDVKKKDAA